MMSHSLQEKDIIDWCRIINAPEDLVGEFLKAAALLRQNGKPAHDFSSLRQNIADEGGPLCGFDGMSVQQKHLLTGLAVLSLFPVMRERHIKMGIDEKVTQDTQKDLLVWMAHEKAKTGHWGLAELDWLRNHISGRIFRLGRLQFKPAIWNGPDAGEVHPGDSVLEVHIPADGKMDPQECRQAMSAAPDFFRRHLPDFKFKALTCESWLLDPALGELLPENSNIIQFQKMWTIYPSEKNERQACERVFGQYPVDPDKAEQKTHLQVQMLKRIKAGRPVCSGIGVILLNLEKDAVR
jgi:hypothetical protein